MKKGIKKLVAGLITSAALCLPVLGITATPTTASAYTYPIFDHLDDVFDQLSKINDYLEFDAWFGGYWEKNFDKFPNSDALEMYFTFYSIWDDMKNPPGAGVKPPLMRP